MPSPIGETRIIVRGMGRVKRKLARLPLSISRESKRFRRMYAADFEKQLKLRAPVASGQLRASINVKPGTKENEITINVDSPYARFQGLGFTPHWIHGSMGQPGSGYRMEDWIESKGYPTSRSGFYFVRKSAQFYIKAQQLMLARLQKYGVTAVKQAIKDAGFKGG